MNALAERAAVGGPAYGPPREGSAWGRKARQEANAAPAREARRASKMWLAAVQPQAAPAAASFPGIKGPSAKRGGAPKRPPRRESPLIPPRFRPAAVRPESRHPSCPPRGFQRKRKRQRPMRPPRRAEAPPGAPGPVRRTRWPPSPCRPGGVFSCPVSRPCPKRAPARR